MVEYYTRDRLILSLRKHEFFDSHNDFKVDRMYISDIKVPYKNGYIYTRCPYICIITRNNIRNYYSGISIYDENKCYIETRWTPDKDSYMFTSDKDMKWCPSFDTIGVYCDIEYVVNELKKFIFNVLLKV